MYVYVHVYACMFMCVPVPALYTLAEVPRLQEKPRPSSWLGTTPSLWRLHQKPWPATCPVPKAWTATIVLLRMHSAGSPNYQSCPGTPQPRSRLLLLLMWEKRVPPSPMPAPPKPRQFLVLVPPKGPEVETCQALDPVPVRCPLHRFQSPRGPRAPATGGVELHGVRLC